ncbi:hypothetical protein AOQ84DRAFT_88208 [Glonium stellatum]|uniref:Heterokaryon incompatibility domain-containing protein n=1 Tax=Glonium stellatum TaxID=574774 RepID=A0A8E2JQK4_9PEZI|nr:hypothetical protein AOQ84DRAFT_88208 [Glonium stellatum]
MQQRYDLAGDIEEAQTRVVPRNNTRTWAKNLRYIVDRRDDESCDFEFEIIQPIDEAVPEPFIAVSYCWPERGTAIELPKTPIRICIGSGLGGYRVREIRVKWDVLSRSFEFARAYGIRRVWIDQECIHQDDSEDVALGVQSMDLVYRKATYTIAILDRHLQTPVSLEMLAELFYDTEHGKYRRRRDLVESTLETQANSMPTRYGGGQLLSKRFRSGSDLSREEMKSEEEIEEQNRMWKELVDSLQSFHGDTREEREAAAEETFGAIMSDRWWTRAWVSQEFLVSHMDKLRILVGCSKDLEERWGEFEDMYEFFADRQRVRGEWVFEVMELVQCSSDVRHSGLQITEIVFSAVADKLGIHRSRGPTHTLIELDVDKPDWSNWRHSPGEQSKHTDAFHPLYFDSIAIAVFPHVFSKDCERPDDKISIMENLTEWYWGHQEETVEIRRLNYYGRIVALALYNGDPSVLFPRSLSFTDDGFLPPTWLPGTISGACVPSSLVFRERCERASRSLVLDRTLLIEGILWKITPFDIISGLGPDIHNWHEGWKKPDKLTGLYPAGPPSHTDCFVRILRELFESGRENLVELILISLARTPLQTPDDIVERMRDLRTWIYENQKGTIEEEYCTDGFEPICKAIANGKPLQLGVCNTGQRMLFGLLLQPNSNATEIFTPLSYLAYMFGGSGYNLLFAGPPIWYTRSSSSSKPTAWAEKVREALQEEGARGAGRGNPHIVSDRTLTVVGTGVDGTEFIISPWLSSAGLLDRDGETGNWRLEPLGEAAAYYFIE